jgi:WD40 repeat protein
MNSVSNNINTYSLGCSPSYIINNLSQSKEFLYFIHNSQSCPRVISINKKLLKEKNINKSVSVFNSSEKNEMLHIKCITMKDSDYIAIGLYNGFKLWNKEGNRLLFQMSKPNIKQNKIYAFTFCSEFLLNSEINKDYPDSILASDNYGQLFLIYGSKSSWKSNKMFSTPNAESILSIGTNIHTNNIGLTLDNGNVLMLKYENGEFDLMKKIEEDGRYNISINCVIFSKKDKSEFFLACGYINGEIRIYSLKDYNIKFSINSHLRSVGPMEVKDDNKIIVGSDDGQINIWKYNDDEDKITLKSNDLFEDRMIVGLIYDKDENCLYANYNDFPEIMVMSNI